MAGVLGIDAAWTEKEPSGVALLSDSAKGWRCATVAPSYASFLGLAERVPVDWSIKATGAIPDASQLLAVARRLLGNQEVVVVAVDMPLSTEQIMGRRAADSAISRAFGSKGAAVHSPNADRPGTISTRLCEEFDTLGFPLATSTTPAGTPGRLVEVYPHPALLTLVGATYRLPYKVSRSRRYWPGSSPAERKANLLTQFEKILTALKAEVHDIPIALPQPSSVVSISGLKRYEDALDALVCAWIGAKYLEGSAVPYGDHTAAIWVP